MSFRRTAKQSELSMLKRNGGIRYALPKIPAATTSIPDTIRRLGLISDGPWKNAGGDKHTADQPEDSHLAHSPAKLKQQRDAIKQMKELATPPSDLLSSASDRLPQAHARRRSSPLAAM